MKLQYRILIIVLACLAAISCTQTPKSGKRIVFIGDSITDGNWGCIYNYKRTSSERSHTDMNHIYGHSYVYIIASYCQSRWLSRNCTEPAPSYWIWDGIHPTPAGHKRMADLWLKKAKI
jgi:phospholipase/lecithinase/hemolysin